MSNKQAVSATVGKIVTDPPGGESYAVVYSTEDYGRLKKGDSITFSLSKWQGERQELHHNQVVELDGVALFKHGWRAEMARPVVPSNKQTERNIQ